MRRTFESANAAACDWISEQAWHHQTFRQLALDKLVYYPVRERFGLSAQMAVRGIAKVVDAYALDQRMNFRVRSISSSRALASWRRFISGAPFAAVSAM